MQSNTPKIWYKQFWPWFLIIVPLTSMVLSFTMMNFAFNSKDSMVIDDYYKEGKGINLKLQKLQQAKNLNMATRAKVTDSNIQIEFVSGLPKSGEALVLDFFHATQKHKDFSVNLLRDANGVYRAPLENAVSGKWKLSLHPIDQQWKIQKVISLPQAKAFALIP